MYTGTLDQYRMDAIPLTAYNRYNHQLKRCRVETNKNYKTYGGKGIDVHYTAREFISWFIKNIPDDFESKNYEVGRIDHSKGYSFDNIVFQEKLENVRERNNRLGNPQDKKAVIVYDKMKGISLEASSTCEASKLTGISQGTVSWLCRKNKDTNKFYKFTFKKEG